MVSSKEGKRFFPELFFTDLPFEQACDKRVLDIFNRPQFEQRTPEWYEARKTCISASSMAAALMQTPEACDYYVSSCDPSFVPNKKKSCSYRDTQLSLVMDKCGFGEKFTGNEYTLWGQKFEPIVSNVYSQINQVDMLEFGLLIHPEISFLGASPDGISTQGVMLEIKCPPMRKVKPLPPIYYFIQMLMQLECTGLEVCDYMDCHFIEYKDSDAWEEHAKEWEEGPGKDDLYHLFGIILSFDEGYDEKDDPIVVHVYPPVTITKFADFLVWANETEDKYIERGIPMERTYYKLNEYYIHRVHASKEWFQSNLPVMQEIWNRILAGRTPEGQEALKKIKDDKMDLLSAKREKKRLAEGNMLFLGFEQLAGGDECRQTPLWEPTKRKSYIHTTWMGTGD
jgi:putative phage-type endonuclease